MDFDKFVKHERRIWHNHFIPSVLAGLLVALISLVFDLTVSNVILYASVGASAVILTNQSSHHLVKLHTTLVAYCVAIVLSLLLYYFNLAYPLHISLNMFLLVTFVGLGLFLFDAFHPPAVTASLSFLLLEGAVLDLLYLFISVFVLLIMIRLMTYIVSQHLSLGEFVKEFKKSFH